MKLYTAGDLEQLLKKPQTAARAETPGGLHTDIMRAVRQAQPERPAAFAMRLPGWIALGAAVLALVLVVLARPRPRATAPTWESVETTLNTARSVAEQIRTTAPLQDEATKLGEDARTAAGFLLSNLPSI